jgi:site-specific recombinase XerD
MPLGCSPSPRKVRSKSAVHAFFHYVSLQEPACAEQCRRVLAIPSKRYERRLIEYLSKEEIDALVAAPDKMTWRGRRDQALLLVAIQTGLRVSELTGLQRQDGVRGECPAEPATPVLPGSRGGPLSRDAVERLVARHRRAAERQCPSLKERKITPHVLRHTAAMQMLKHGIDRSVIEDLGDIPVRRGSDIYLRDLGLIEDSTDIPTGYSLVNGKRAVCPPGPFQPAKRPHMVRPVRNLAHSNLNKIRHISHTT